MFSIFRIKRAFEYLFNFLFLEYPKGVDFSIRDKFSSSKDLSLNGYARTSKKALKNLYTFINVTNKKFLDIGSGKGAVVYDTYCLGAALSHGLEYNIKLHRIALRNFERLDCIEHCNSINIDARNFAHFNNYDIYFLFNPFDDDVYRQVIEKLRKQIVNDLTTRWIIAYGKSNHTAILNIENIKLLKKGTCPYRRNNFSIYQIN